MSTLVIAERFGFICHTEIYAFSAVQYTVLLWPSQNNNTNKKKYVERTRRGYILTRGAEACLAF